ncbi:TPA: hypothetical protein ACGSSZ_004817, partial [Vibrio parahaemolyticus]
MIDMVVCKVFFDTFILKIFNLVNLMKLLCIIKTVLLSVLCIIKVILLSALCIIKDRFILKGVVEEGGIK